MWTNNPQIWLMFLGIMALAQALMQWPIVYRHFHAVAKTAFSRALVGLFIGQLVFIAGSKPNTMGYVAQFVTVLRNGYVIDESGVIAKATEQAVIESFIDYAGQINEAASNTVVAAAVEFETAAEMVTNSTRRVIYIASYLPRSGTGGGAVTNHNIAATVEQTRMFDSTNLTAWVWFSAVPAFAPGMFAEIDVGAGAVRCKCVTNFYPDTELINGAPCVKYVFAIPEAARGVQFIPSYEVQFGSADTPLIVPLGGVTVETDGVIKLPFSGTDSYFGGRVEVSYKGGIATGVRIDGNPVTNGVYQL